MGTGISIINVDNGADLLRQPDLYPIPYSRDRSNKPDWQDHALPDTAMLIVCPGIAGSALFLYLI